MGRQCSVCEDPQREAIDIALEPFSEAERHELARLLTKLAEGWPR